MTTILMNLKSLKSDIGGINVVLCVLIKKYDLKT